MNVSKVSTKEVKMKLQVPEEHLRQIGKVLIDPSRPLKERFRALFTLKNLGKLHLEVSYFWDILIKYAVVVFYLHSPPPPKKQKVEFLL